jgi:hypothetical protein
MRAGRLRFRRSAGPLGQIHYLCLVRATPPELADVPVGWYAVDLAARGEENVLRAFLDEHVAGQDAADEVRLPGLLAQVVRAYRVPAMPPQLGGVPGRAVVKDVLGAARPGAVESVRAPP